MVINNLPYVMINCLFFTLIIEVTLAVLLQIKAKKDICNIILVNIMTNPIVVSLPFFINIRYGLTARNVVVLVLEVFTVLLEGKIYSKFLNFKKINPYNLSLLLNLCSYIIGDIIKYIIF